MATITIKEPTSFQIQRGLSRTFRVSGLLDARDALDGQTVKIKGKLLLPDSNDLPGQFLAEPSDREWHFNISVPDSIPLPAIQLGLIVHLFFEETLVDSDFKMVRFRRS